jgi:hypothetical protein
LPGEALAFQRSANDPSPAEAREEKQNVFRLFENARRVTLLLRTPDVEARNK